MKFAIAFLCLCSLAWCQQPPAPDPKPVPPAPKPTTPVAAITVVDSHGMPVVDEIGLGQQIVVTSEKAVRGSSPLSLVWIVSPSVQTYTAPDGATLVITTPGAGTTLTIMQLVALGDEVAWQRIAIKCGQGPQPPPGPTPGPGPGPDPGPGPTPAPVPTAPRLFLAVVENERSRTADAVPVMNAIAVWNSFRVDGGDWRFYDASTTEEKGKKALADAAIDHVNLPAMVVYNFDTGAKLATVPLPKSIPALQAVVSKFKATK